MSKPAKVGSELFQYDTGTKLMTMIKAKPTRVVAGINQRWVAGRINAWSRQSSPNPATQISGRMACQSPERGARALKVTSRLASKGVIGQELQEIEVHVAVQVWKV